MKRIVFLMLVGCGGDDGMQTPDAPVNNLPEYDVSCMPNTVPNPAAQLVMEGVLADQTNLAMRNPLINTELKIHSVPANNLIAMVMTDVEGKYAYMLPTNGQPTFIRYE